VPAYKRITEFGSGDYWRIFRVLLLLLLLLLYFGFRRVFHRAVPPMISGKLFLFVELDLRLVVLRPYGIIALYYVCIQLGKLLNDYGTARFSDF